MRFKISESILISKANTIETKPRRFRTALVISTMILSSVNCRRRMLIY